MNGPVEARVERRFITGKIDIAFLIYDQDGGRSVALPLQFKRIDDNVVEAATVSMRPDAAQQLMDELWRVGFRPTEGTGSAGSLAATQHHLKDMQRIAFQLLRDEQAVAEVNRQHGVTTREVRP